MCRTAFGPFRLDGTTGELFRDGTPVPLPPKATLILTALVSSPGRLVTRDDLYAAAWSDTVVEFDQGLNTCIRQIRQALGDDARNPRYIETIPRRGYRFCHPISPPQQNRFPLLSTLLLAASILLVLSVRLLSEENTAAPISHNSTPSLVPIALSDFRIDGFNVSTRGIDEQLEASVRSGLAVRGVTSDTLAPAYRLTGIIVPADAGATLDVSLIRLSDDERIWSGSFNPFCSQVQGDPVRAIGHIVARTAIAHVQKASA